jgi:hypothetical protein
MKKVNVIVIVLLSMLAIYIFYGLIRESWTKIDHILLIILLAGGMLNSNAIERNRKREKKVDAMNPTEEYNNKD